MGYVGFKSVTSECHYFATVAQGATCQQHSPCYRHSRCESTTFQQYSQFWLSVSALSTTGWHSGRDAAFPHLACPVTVLVLMAG